jgi:hypothetical protein
VPRRSGTDRALLNNPTVCRRAVVKSAHRISVPMSETQHIWEVGATCQLCRSSSAPAGRSDCVKHRFTRPYARRKGVLPPSACTFVNIERPIDAKRRCAPHSSPRPVWPRCRIAAKMADPPTRALTSVRACRATSNRSRHDSVHVRDRIPLVGRRERRHHHGRHGAAARPRRRRGR